MLTARWLGQLMWLMGHVCAALSSLHSLGLHLEVADIATAEASHLPC